MNWRKDPLAAEGTVLLRHSRGRDRPSPGSQINLWDLYALTTRQPGGCPGIRHAFPRPAPPPRRHADTPYPRTRRDGAMPRPSRYRRRSDVPPGNRAGAVEDIRRRVDVAVQGQTAVSAAKLPYAERHGLHAAAAPSGSSITRCTDVRRAARTMRACRTTPPGITANRMSPTPFTDSAYRLPLRRMAGFPPRTNARRDACS